MKNIIPPCPQCGLENTYADQAQFICPDCTHEWPQQVEVQEVPIERVVKDSNGQILQDGDAVLLIKDLKVKGSSLVLKKGSKAKSIRIIDGDHEIDCKIDGVSLQLKAEFLKKA